jgi:hypothetical protein
MRSEVVIAGPEVASILVATGSRTPIPPTRRARFGQRAVEHRAQTREGST